MFVAAALAPSAIVADVTRRESVSAGQIYWRQELRRTGIGFSQVVIGRWTMAAMIAPHWIRRMLTITGRLQVSKTRNMTPPVGIWLSVALAFAPAARA